jgi:aconitate hydratase
MMMVAETLKGRKIDPSVELGIAPGSKQVLRMLAENGAMADLIAAGARLIESGCGPCIGQGFSPADGTVTLRTFNRNFAGRTGTKGDQAYLVSPETAVASAIMGEITDPRDMKNMMGVSYPKIKMPKEFDIDDSMIDAPVPADQASKVQVLRGPTIVVPESPKPLPETLDGNVLLKCGDKITTDHIMPAGVFLKYRSNVPEYSKSVFNCFNEEGQPTFAERALALKKEGTAGVIIGGDSYGQGSSREHAALCPMYLGVRVVIAKAIERIHKANLINFCIVPIEFDNPMDYDKIGQGNQIEIADLIDAIKNSDSVTIADKTSGVEFTGKLTLSQRDRDILLAGGLLAYTRKAAR